MHSKISHQCGGCSSNTANHDSQGYVTQTLELYLTGRVSGLHGYKQSLLAAQSGKMYR